MSARSWARVAVICASMVSSSAQADDGRERLGKSTFLGRLWHAAVVELEAQAATRLPALVPPSPIEIKWRAQRLGSIDLRAPLLALSAADLDGDGRAEAIALTTRELIVLRPEPRGRIGVVTRTPLPAARPSVRPRDPVGSLVVRAQTPDAPLEISARSSERARGVTLRMNAGVLEELNQSDGFPLCAGGSATLVAGRNYFEPASITWQDPTSAPIITGPFFAAACARGYVDPAGHAMSGFAAVSVSGKLDVRVQRLCRAGDSGCNQVQPRESSIAGVGTVFTLADLDRDGRVDVLAAASRPPGDPDRVTVWSARGSRWKPVFSHGFSGGVAGLAVADFDGDGDLEGIVAVRLIGTDRVDLWALN